jgi:N utilization substance protein A
MFIKNALLPAEVKQVIVVDEAKKSALAIVGDNQFSLAIGKQGLNVRLANRLVDWNIDVKTEQQFAEMDLSAETKRAVSALFGDTEEEEIVKISELPDIPENIVEILKNNKIEMIEDLVSLSKDEIAGLKGIGEEDAALISKIIDESVEIVEEEEEVVEEAPAEKAAAPAAQEAAPAVPETAPEVSETTPEVSDTTVEAQEESVGPEQEGADEETEEDYECPECGASITTDMTACPNCGVGLSFEEEED